MGCGQKAAAEDDEREAWKEALANFTEKVSTENGRAIVLRYLQEMESQFRYLKPMELRLTSGEHFRLEDIQKQLRNILS